MIVLLMTFAIVIYEIFGEGKMKKVFLDSDPMYSK